MMLITMGRDEFYHNSVTHDSDSRLFEMGRWSKGIYKCDFSYDGSRERELLERVGKVDWLHYPFGEERYVLGTLIHRAEQIGLSKIVFHRSVYLEDIVYLLDGLFGTPTNSPSLSVDLTDLPEEKKSDVIRLTRKSKATVVEV